MTTPVWEIPETIDERLNKLETGFEISSDEEIEELPENIMYIKDNIIACSSNDPYVQPMKNWYKRKYVIEYGFLNEDGEKIDKTLYFSNHWRFKRKGIGFQGLGKAIEGKKYKERYIWLKTPELNISMFLYSLKNKAYYQVNFIKHRNKHEIIPPAGYISVWNKETKCIEAVFQPSLIIQPELIELKEFIHCFYRYYKFISKNLTSGEFISFSK